MKGIWFALVMVSACVRQGDEEPEPNDECPTVALSNPGFDDDTVGSKWIRVGNTTWTEADARAPSKPNVYRLQRNLAKVAQVVAVPEEWTAIELRGSWATNEMIPQPSGATTPIVSLLVTLETTEGGTPLRELGRVDLTRQPALSYRSFEVGADWPFGGGAHRVAIELRSLLDPAIVSLDNLTLTGTCD